MSRPTVSLCMIVRDEERLIEACLRSVQVWIDEMIVVDTGSLDNTAQIALSMGASVLTYEWNNHFADARNYGLEHAKSDWILYLDADEELSPLGNFDLHKALQETQASILSLHLVNYIGETPNEDEAFHIAHPRFFRNHIGLKFKYAIHETLNIDDIFLDRDTTDLLEMIPLKLFHRGYMEPITIQKNKFARNMTLLQQEASAPAATSNPWIEYHIASEYYRVHQYDKAFEYVNLSIVRFIQSGKMPPSMLYKLKYAILFNTGSIDGAWPGIEKAIALYPDYVDLHFYKGVICYLKGWYTAAIDVFRHCIESGEMTGQHLTLRGTGSFHAYYYLGLCWEKLGNDQEAINAYEKAYELSPTYTIAGDALNRLNEIET
ncbi:glycosyltransferase [Paenibacillus sp. CGMCC 1.16610]|uniref:Glycosyltransferase n=1 Tax=Paenibacillus anseongense TaxID=2682845 RepID=A0ABW9UJM9_9BACL|nr:MULTISPECIES: glycosyltransferase [Paenibacillus]MBA2941594.1 glycosyltransferase [Paenibacillus sp. CGMCC 1.16610]MVQ40407.1 glycosyltransferase [Paenibacillus anseongense]